MEKPDGRFRQYREASAEHQPPTLQTVTLGQLADADMGGYLGSLVPETDLRAIFRPAEITDESQVAAASWLDTIHRISALAADDTSPEQGAARSYLARVRGVTLTSLAGAQTEEQVDQILLGPGPGMPVARPRGMASDVIHTATDFLATGTGFMAAVTGFAIGTKAAVHSVKDLFNEVFRSAPDPSGQPGS
jgi:hypothetical protein